MVTHDITDLGKASRIEIWLYLQKRLQRYALETAEDASRSLSPRQQYHARLLVRQSIERAARHFN